MARTSLAIARSFVELLLLMLAGLASVVVTICIKLTMDDFKGNCPLYASVEHKGGNSGMVHFMAKSTCQFIISIQVIVLIVAVASFIFRLIICIRKTPHSSSFVPLLFTAGFSLCWCFVLITACICSVGFSMFCKDLVDTTSLHCRYWQNSEWIYIRGDRFYDILDAAQIAGWISCCVWLLLPLTAWSGVCFLMNERRLDSDKDGI